MFLGDATKTNNSTALYFWLLYLKTMINFRLEIKCLMKWNSIQIQNIQKFCRFAIQRLSQITPWKKSCSVWRLVHFVWKYQEAWGIEFINYQVAFGRFRCENVNNMGGKSSDRQEYFFCMLVANCVHAKICASKFVHIYGRHFEHLDCSFDNPAENV